MKFSIVVPVYNAEEYIQECCDSVFQQTYNNFELILIDDGSSDSSGMLCNQFSEKFSSKCISIHTENQGPLLARQTGIREATGDVLVFLDSDDCIREDMLTILADCFGRTDCDIVLYNASNKDDYSNEFCSFPLQANCIIERNDKHMLYNLMARSLIPNAVWLKAVKKACMDIFPDMTDYPCIMNGEDLLMSLYMITSARKIVYLNENLYFYRQREGSIVHSFNPNRMQSIKTVHREMERFIDLWGLPELHPVHYAREVRGWIENLLILLANRKRITPVEFHQQFHAMASDSYFIRAYASMDKKELPFTDQLLAKWLCNRRFLLLYMVGFLRNLKSKLVKHYESCCL